LGVWCVPPVPWPEPDRQIAAAIAAKYRGNRPRPLAALIRDRLGEWLHDEDFAAAFGVRGRPGWSASRLALVTVLQRAESLPDRQAAEAARTRIDWQYLLGLPLDDPGFDHTVLVEFRTRVAEAGLEQVALDALLERLTEAGLITAGGKQRTDSTHVVAAVAALNRLELVGQSVRAVLEALSAAHPAWLAQRICVGDCTRRYGTSMTSWRPPLSQAKRDELAIASARDGYRLLEAVYDRPAPAWPRELPAVDVLRRVLVQNYTRTITSGGREVIKRREKRLRATVSRLAISASPPPTIWTPAGASNVTTSGWATSCTSPKPATMPHPAPATTPRHVTPKPTTSRRANATRTTASMTRPAHIWCSRT
jgi:transposase